MHTVSRWLTWGIPSLELLNPVHYPASPHVLNSILHSRQCTCRDSSDSSSLSAMCWSAWYPIRDPVSKIRCTQDSLQSYVGRHVIQPYARIVTNSPIQCRISALRCHDSINDTEFNIVSQHVAVHQPYQIISHPCLSSWWSVCHVDLRCLYWLTEDISGDAILEDNLVSSSVARLVSS